MAKKRGILLAVTACSYLIMVIFFLLCVSAYTGKRYEGALDYAKITMGAAYVTFVLMHAKGFFTKEEA